MVSKKLTLYGEVLGARKDGRYTHFVFCSYVLLLSAILYSNTILNFEEVFLINHHVWPLSKREF